LYQQIKKRHRGNDISTQRLKHIIQCAIIREKGNRGGGNKKGIPQTYLYHLIGEMGEWNLIKRINHTTYRVLKSDCEKHLRGFPF